MKKTARLVIVQYDAGSNSFTVDPNPVVLLPGITQVFFVIQTINCGESPPGMFTAIEVLNKPAFKFLAVDGFARIFKGSIDNDLSEGDKEINLAYRIHIEYKAAGQLASVDPSIVLLPPTGGP
ncbi:MAG: hypothetical protein K0U98_11700 [Deltaproteobacteria bacterium]|nr:hypothetical protein [Deltaproteobacteria bacterium]